MKSELQALLQTAFERFIRSDTFPELASHSLSPQELPLERARDTHHGDFASPVALALAKKTKCKPCVIAEALIAFLPPSELIDRVEIAGPGFINFYLAHHAYYRILYTLLEDPLKFTRLSIGTGATVQVEFVSSNPTGPLHVGHGRGAAYGATIANLLEAVGYCVQREYYVNDSGRQMDILTISVWLRYLGLFTSIPFPTRAYQGNYLIDIAKAAKEKRTDLFVSPDRVWQGLDESDEQEILLDTLVERAKQKLGETKYRWLSDFALNALLSDIREDLQEFRVHYDQWFSERTLSASVIDTVETLHRNGHIYLKEGAKWFRSTTFGDEKDRVVIRSNGQNTYFASDIAYHANKLARKFTHLINVWGADHHGYIARVKGAIAGLGGDPNSLTIRMVQLVSLFRNGEKVPMSTRSGEFVTLRELREEVGNDAARFFYVMRKNDQSLDFDLDLAKSHSNDNPVYYIQYAHARICSVLRELDIKNWRWSFKNASAHLTLLSEKHEIDLLRTLSRYPEVLESGALHYEPHQLAFYLRELANHFHAYYNTHTFLVNEEPLRNARIALISATQYLIADGLALLGVDAPEAM